VKITFAISFHVMGKLGEDKLFPFVKTFCLSIFSLPELGKLNFDAFSEIAGHFLEEEDDEAMQQELKEAFRLYDREGMFCSVQFFTEKNILHKPGASMP